MTDQLLGDAILLPHGSRRVSSDRSWRASAGSVATAALQVGRAVGFATVRHDDQAIDHVPLFGEGRRRRRSASASSETSISRCRMLP